MRAYLQLLPIPNVFTALADVMMGYLFMHGTLEPWPLFALLAASSACLYLSGMVLNDYFDRDVDARERPSRPIPSGRVSAGAARALGFGLLIGGIVLAWWAGYVSASVLADQGVLMKAPGFVSFGGYVIDARTAGVGTLLGLVVLLYDAVIKSKLPAGAPFVMPVCRVLNVLLGMIGAAASSTITPLNPLILGGVFLYIFGIMLYSTGEAGVSKRGLLVAGAVAMFAGLGLYASYPYLNAHDQWRDLDTPEYWWLFWVVLAIPIVRRCVQAIIDPKPERVQAAVKHCILSIIVIDAALVVPVAGVGWAIVILALLAPATLLGQWIYST